MSLLGQTSGIQHFPIVVYWANYGPRAIPQNIFVVGTIWELFYIFNKEEYPAKTIYSFQRLKCSLSDPLRKVCQLLLIWISNSHGEIHCCLVAQ